MLVREVPLNLRIKAVAAIIRSNNTASGDATVPRLPGATTATSIMTRTTEVDHAIAIISAASPAASALAPARRAYATVVAVLDTRPPSIPPITAPVRLRNIL